MVRFVTQFCFNLLSITLTLTWITVHHRTILVYYIPFLHNIKRGKDLQKRRDITGIFNSLQLTRFELCTNESMHGFY